MTNKDIFLTVFITLVAFVLVAGSTQIALPLLAAAQFILGIWFAVAAVVNGWQAARK